MKTEISIIIIISILISIPISLYVNLLLALRYSRRNFGAECHTLHIEGTDCIAYGWPIWIELLISAVIFVTLNILVTVISHNLKRLTDKN